MTSTIFNKLKDAKGAVEFIESSILISFLFLLLSLLFIISLKTVNKSIGSENIYYKTSLLMDDVSKDFEIWKNIDLELLNKSKEELNNKLGRLSQKQIDLTSKGSLFKNTIKVSQDATYNRYNFSKIYLVDAKRKIDFVEFMYKELSQKEIGGIKLVDLFTNKNPLINRMIGN